mmetsp:Transcript_29233/g.52571  ORF Transcript_29233/g.52571 Transcript_29233/m.52571 type:complete len:242 (-) Transcript_29233:261-986(-)
MALDQLVQVRAGLISTASLPTEQAQLVELARQLPARQGRQDTVLGLLPTVPAAPTATISLTTPLALGLPCAVSGVVVSLEGDRPLPIGLRHACGGGAGHTQWGDGLGGSAALGEQLPLLLQYVQQLVLLGHGATCRSRSSRGLEGSGGGWARRLGGHGGWGCHSRRGLDQWGGRLQALGRGLLRLLLEYQEAMLRAVGLGGGGIRVDSGHRLPGPGGGDCWSQRLQRHFLVRGEVHRALHR